MNEEYKNCEGYSDPTAYYAIKNAYENDFEEYRFHLLLHTIFNICKLSGFRIEGRITIKDIKTGRIWE